MKKFLSFKKLAIMFSVSVLVFLSAVVSYSGENIKLDKLKKITPADSVKVSELNGEFNKDNLTIGETFAGEVFSYDVSFWIFKKRGLK